MATHGDARNGFVIAPYYADATGRMMPDLPSECPYRHPDDDACHVRRHHWRERGTGPEHPLCVAVCRTHGRAFTLYPPGYVPYSRVPVVRLNPDGSLSDDSCLEGTVFQASLDASRGELWYWEDPIVDASQRATQRRHIDVAERVLGIVGEERDRVAAARTLGVPWMVGQSALANAPSARTLKARGARVAEMLSVIEIDRTTVDRLLASGHQAGVWGEPFRVDPANGRPRSLRRRYGGTRGPPG